MVVVEKILKVTRDLIPLAVLKLEIGKFDIVLVYQSHVTSYRLRY